MVRAPRGERRERRRRWVWLAGVGLLVLLVLAYAVPSVLAARSLTTPERRALSGSPADLGLAYEEVAFPVRGEEITLRGWWLPARGPQAVILVHGRNSVRDDPGLGYLRLAAGLVGLGYHVLMFDLRGHGESDSAPFALGAVEWRDVLGAVDFARGRGTPSEQVAVVGFSAGAAAALGAAVRDPGIGAVVADGVWPDLRRLLEAELPEAGGLPAFYMPGVSVAGRLLYGIDVDAAKPVEDVAALAAAGRPLLLVHEGADRHTDAAGARRLDAAAAGDARAEMWWVAEAPHVKAYALHPEEYLARLSAFLEAAIGRPPDPAALLATGLPTGRWDQSARRWPR